jgi:hypothetical protein
MSFVAWFWVAQRFSAATTKVFVEEPGFSRALSEQ